jgi:hypothetical protein
MLLRGAVGQVVAVPTSELAFTRWQIELSYAPAAETIDARTYEVISPATLQGGGNRHDFNLLLDILLGMNAKSLSPALGFGDFHEFGSVSPSFVGERDAISDDRCLFMRPTVPDPLTDRNNSWSKTGGRNIEPPRREILCLRRGVAKETRPDEVRDIERPALFSRQSI